MDTLGAGLIFALVIFGLIVAVLWICVPFLIMGTNKRLDKIIKQNASLIERARTPTGT